MQHARQYHLSRDGKPLGTYDEGVMRELLRAGKLKPTDDYWTPGMKAWAKLAILPPRRQSSSTGTQRTSAQTARPATTTATPVARKIRWTKLWPIPALVLLALLIGYSASQTQETPKTAAVEERKPSVRKEPKAKEPARETVELTRGFAIFNPMGKELFPSHIISFANTRLKPRQPSPDDAPHYGHADFIAGVLIDEPRINDKFVVEVTADRFMRASSVTFTVRNDAGTATAGPAPLFDFEALAKVQQTTPFNVTIKVRRNEGEPVIFTEVWQAHQINDCPTRFSVQRLTPDKFMTNTRHQGGRVIAGYVNENHPMIDQILAEAKATGISPSFTGYGEGKDDIVRQIDAVWRALHKRGITYSNTADSTRSPLHSFQHVRMLDQSLSSGQANCVDATVMLASVLKKIGLNVGIILVPKHAYLVVYDKTGKKREFAIESTGIPHSTLREAINAATEDEKESLRKIEDRLDDEEDDEYYEVAIEECRRSGIQPIPFAR
jgi:hypothetical protein